MTGMRRGWYWSTLALITVLLAVYADRRDLYGVYQEYRASTEEVRMLQIEVEQRSKTKAQVQRRVEQLNSDPLEVEAAIRKSKRLVREGEIIYRVALPIDAKDKKALVVP